MKRYAYAGALFILAAGLNFYAQTPDIVFCTFYTPSHETLATEWMIPSLKDDVPMIVGTSEQKCESATYFKNGWTATMRDKVDFLLDILKTNRGKIIVSIDPDIIFFRPVKDRIIELLVDCDFVGQRDKPDKVEVCAGFVAMHANDVVIALWEQVRSLMRKKGSLCDQVALNAVLHGQSKTLGLRWAFLPTDEFFGGGTFKREQWAPGKDLYIPDNPRMFHANFTIFCHKEEMLQFVKDTLIKRKADSELF
jgi:hypothetical protein